MCSSATLSNTEDRVTGHNHVKKRPRLVAVIDTRHNAHESLHLRRVLKVVIVSQEGLDIVMSSARG